MVIASDIELPLPQIADFCRKWEIQEFALFGSILTEAFGPESDIDVLVAYKPGRIRDLLDLVDMQAELSDLLGRKVDIVNRAAMERSENAWKRHNILRSAQTIYAA